MTMTITPMEFFQIIGILASAGAALTTIWFKVGVPFVAFIKKIVKSFETLDMISEQFAPNGGSTLRDAINRIEARQVVQEQRQKMLAMDAPFAIFETDAAGNYVDVNRTYCRWVGRSPSELSGKGWVNSIAQLWQEEVMDSWTMAVQQEREFTMKFRLVDTDGETMPVFGTAFPLYDTKKVLVGWVGIIYKSDDHIPEDPDKDESLSRAIEKIKNK